jgi:release factor glutamine methyltransferase
VTAALLKDAATRLATAGIDEPLREARILLAAAMNAQSTAHLDRVPTDIERAAFGAMIARREGREPVAYILGRREFWSLDFVVSPAVLIPRPDSETLIEAALGHFKNAPPKSILDLGTGSGCLLVSLLTEWPQATGLGVDISGAALALAGLNARRLGVGGRAEFRQGDWATDLEQQFDLVVANPPYIRDQELLSLDRDVAHFEPLLALKGGSDGLDPLRRIADRLRNVMRPGAVVIVEIGIAQAAAASRIFVNADLEVLSIANDLGGHERAVVARLPHASGA